MGFVNDLKQWEEREEIVAKILSRYFWETVSKNVDDRKWVDLIIDNWKLLIEVKYDRMVKDTGNYVFEFKCNWKQSGVAKTYNTEEWGEIHPHFLVQAHEDGFELYHTYKLLSFVEANNDRVVKGWDGWRSEMYLIKKEAVEHLVIKKFSYEDVR